MYQLKNLKKIYMYKYIQEELIRKLSFTTFCKILVYLKINRQLKVNFIHPLFWWCMNDKTLKTLDNITLDH